MTPREAIMETQFDLRALVEPAGGLSIKAQKRKLQSLLGWSPKRIENLWYGYSEARAHEVFTLKAMLEAKHEREKRREGLLYEMDCRVGRAFPPEHGSSDGQFGEGDRPLEYLARRKGNQGR